MRVNVEITFECDMSNELFLTDKIREALKPLLERMTVSTQVSSAAHNYKLAYMEVLEEFEGLAVQSVEDVVKLDRLTNDAAILFRRYLTARVDYKMVTAPIDRSVL